MLSLLDVLLAVCDICLHLVQVNFAYSVTIFVIIDILPVHVDVHDVLGDHLR